MAVDWNEIVKWKVELSIFILIQELYFIPQAKVFRLCKRAVMNNCCFWCKKMKYYTKGMWAWWWKITLFSDLSLLDLNKINFRAWHGGQVPNHWFRLTCVIQWVLFIGDAAVVSPRIMARSWDTVKTLPSFNSTKYVTHKNFPEHSQ
jgi:hypothetical protein